LEFQFSTTETDEIFILFRHGHFQSVQLGWKPFLNVDLMNKGFYEDWKIPKYIEKMLRVRPGDPLSKENVSALQSHLKGLKVSLKNVVLFLKTNSKAAFRSKVSMLSERCSYF